MTKIKLAVFTLGMVILATATLCSSCSKDAPIVSTQEDSDLKIEVEAIRDAFITQIKFIRI